MVLAEARDITARETFIIERDDYEIDREEDQGTPRITS